jgi:hypothetical protein
MTTSCPARHLAFVPAIAAPRSVGRGRLLRDDTFQGHSACRLEDRVAPALEVLDISDLHLMLAVDPCEEVLENALAVHERPAPQVLAFEKEEVEGEEDQVVGLALRQRGLQTCEIRRAAMIEGDDLPVDHAIGQSARRFRNGGAEFGGPIEAIPSLQRDGSVLDTHLDAIAVELDFVNPVAFSGGTVD